jgi:hypothetical protein
MSLFKATAVVAMVTVGAGQTADAAPSPRSQDPTAFLQQLAGEWSVVTEAILGPGQAPIRNESREVARLLGGKWLVAESTGTAPDGQPFTSILTLGYDPAREQFVGTWIDSMQQHLWSYSGVLEDSGTALTLETEGPISGDPTTTAKYREVIEIEEANRKVMRSMILGPASGSSSHALSTGGTHRPDESEPAPWIVPGGLPG